MFFEISKWNRIGFWLAAYTFFSRYIRKNRKKRDDLWQFCSHTNDEGHVWNLTKHRNCQTLRVFVSISIYQSDQCRLRDFVVPMMRSHTLCWQIDSVSWPLHFMLWWNKNTTFDLFLVLIHRCKPLFIYFSIFFFAENLAFNNFLYLFDCVQLWEKWEEKKKRKEKKMLPISLDWHRTNNRDRNLDPDDLMKKILQSECKKKWNESIHHHLILLCSAPIPYNHLRCLWIEQYYPSSSSFSSP